MNDKLHKILQVLDFRFWAIFNTLLFCIFALIGAEVKSLVVSGISAIIWVALAIVEAIRESLPQRQMIHINYDAEVMERLLDDASQRLLADIREQLKKQKEAKIKEQAQATKLEDKDEEDRQDTNTPEVDDEPIHRPLTEAPEDGTLVYLHTQGESKNIVPTPYAKEYHSQALREGRIFATKEDALVYLYGDHYSTTKPEDEIGRGTLPDGA